MRNELYRFGRAVEQKLSAFGFELCAEGYCYVREILDGQFRLTVTVATDGTVKTELVDSATDEPYTLHLYEGASGAFVGSVREAYESVLDEIAESCYVREVFHTDAARAVIAYARRQYGDELEFLWEKYEGNAVLRRKDNRKWYAALLTVQAKKLGLKRDGTVFVIDLRADPEEIPLLVDGIRYFNGYHMNKKHWISIVLDGSVPDGEISKRLDESYLLAKK